MSTLETGPLVRMSITPTPSVRRQGGQQVQLSPSAGQKAAAAMKSLQRSPAPLPSSPSNPGAAADDVTHDGGCGSSSSCIHAATQLLKYELLRVQSKLDHHVLTTAQFSSSSNNNRRSAHVSSDAHSLEAEIMRICEKQQQFEKDKEQWEQRRQQLLLQQQQQQHQYRSSSPSASGAAGSGALRPAAFAGGAGAHLYPTTSNSSTPSSPSPLLTPPSFSPPKDPSGDILSQLLLLLWTKIEELQQMTGTFVAAKDRLAGKQWPSPVPLFAAALPRAAGKLEGFASKVAELIGDMLETEMQQHQAEHGQFDGAILDGASTSDATHHHHPHLRNSHTHYNKNNGRRLTNTRCSNLDDEHDSSGCIGAASSTPNGLDGDGGEEAAAVAASASSALAAACSSSNVANSSTKSIASRTAICTSPQQQQQQQQRNTTIVSSVSLPYGQVLLRSKPVRADTIRALVANCQLEPETEAALRDIRPAQKKLTMFAMAAGGGGGGGGACASSPSASTDTASDSNPVKFVDLDALFRRVSAAIDTFAQEVVNVKKARSPNSSDHHNPRHVPQRGAAAVMGNQSVSPLAHRMLLPPMMLQSPDLQQQHQQQLQVQASSPVFSASMNPTALFAGTAATAAGATGAISSPPNSYQLASPSAALNINSGTSSQQNNLNNNNNNNSRGEKKAHEIVERERRQHAIETADYEQRIEDLSKRVQQLETEIARERQQHHRQLEAAKHSGGDNGKTQERLRLVAEEAAELRETAAGLKRVRLEESQRSGVLLAELEKTVAKQAETINDRELDCARLERGIHSLIELFYDNAKDVAEHHARADIAAKLHHLSETTYPPALLAQSHELREKMFQLQCQVDERERSLGATGQRLRDAKEQLQVLAADDASFLQRLKLSDEWRALTLAADEETAAAVRRIGAMFAERAAKLKHQEDTQAHRLKTLEARLAEEVVSRRKRNVQELPSASDEAGCVQARFKEQAAGIEEQIKKALSAKVIRIGLVASAAIGKTTSSENESSTSLTLSSSLPAKATGGSNNSGNSSSNNASTTIAHRIMARLLDAKKTKETTAKELKKILTADL